MECLKRKKRAAEFHRTPKDAEIAMHKLNEAQLMQVKAASDYMAMFWKGLAGLYICRDTGKVDAGQLLRSKSLDDKFSTEARWQDETHSFMQKI